MNGESKKTEGADPDLDSGWDFDDEDGESEASTRPTMAPPFDLESYAKAAMVPSADATRPTPAGGAEAQTAPRSDRGPSSGAESAPIIPNRVISLPPPPPVPESASPPGAAQGPITRPPPFTMDGPLDLAPNMPVPPPSAPASQRITPREMKRIETALIASRQGSQKPSVPTRKDSGGAPRADTLLTMANSRAPSATPVRVVAVAMPEPEPEALPPAVEKEGPAAGSSTNPIVEMQERFALGDYSGALVMAESMLEENPSHVEAREYADSCRAILQQMYTARIGPLDRVPVVETARDQLRWLSIDHRTGFILSLVDGVSSLEMILDVCGMPPLDALRMLFELVQQRIISIKD